VDHRRDEGAAQQIAGDHGEDDRQGQRDEEELGRAADEDHGDEDDADAKGRDEGGDGDLRGAVEDRLHQALLLVQVAVDVLDFHRGVVHQDADGEGQPPRVMTFSVSPEPAHDDDGDQDRKRNRGDDDHRAPPAAEEDEDHQGGQPRRDRGLADHPVTEART
jgi:hypothetical protein